MCLTQTLLSSLCLLFLLLLGLPVQAGMQGPVALAGSIGGKGSSSRQWGMDFSFGQPRPAQQKLLLPKGGHSRKGRGREKEWKQQNTVKFIHSSLL